MKPHLKTLLYSRKHRRTDWIAVQRKHIDPYIWPHIALLVQKGYRTNSCCAALGPRRSHDQKPRPKHQHLCRFKHREPGMPTQTHSILVRPYVNVESTTKQAKTIAAIVAGGIVAVEVTPSSPNHCIVCISVADETRDLWKSNKQVANRQRRNWLKLVWQRIQDLPDASLPADNVGQC